MISEHFRNNKKNHEKNAEHGNMELELADDSEVEAAILDYEESESYSGSLAQYGNIELTEDKGQSFLTP
ncbi:hypothetical protein HDV02_003871, partial [Globomyces sp. JEL0801]